MHCLKLAPLEAAEFAGKKKKEFLHTEAGIQVYHHYSHWMGWYSTALIVFTIRKQ